MWVCRACRPDSCSVATATARPPVGRRRRSGPRRAPGARAPPAAWVRAPRRAAPSTSTRSGPSTSTRSVGSPDRPRRPHLRATACPVLSARRQHAQVPRHRLRRRLSHMTERTQDMDHDTLDEFLGRFVGDLGAVGSAGAMVIGNRLGLYRALARGPGDRRRSSPSAPGTTCAISPSGCAARPRPATSPTTRETGGVLPHRGAGVLPRGPERARPSPRRPSSCSATCAPSRGSPRRSAPGRASAGTSTTTTSSSGATRSTVPATSPTSCRPGSRRSTASRRS